ncbi:MFS transporter [Niallia oryzisoli]|uniref:MFS transporter n=1 Tax=Niallia oryzisoli TaxID=1737571 RepID=A0ABZ2CP10_9BACI
MVFFTLGLIFLSQADIDWYIIAAGALVALGYGTLFSCCLAIAVKNSPRHRVGLATSTYYIAMDAGSGIGPIFIGIIVPLAGYRGMYMTMAVIVFLSIFLSFYTILYTGRRQNL